MTTIANSITNNKTPSQQLIFFLPQSNPDGRSGGPWCLVANANASASWETCGMRQCTLEEAVALTTVAAAPINNTLDYQPSLQALSAAGQLPSPTASETLLLSLAAQDVTAAGGSWPSTTGISLTNANATALTLVTLFNGASWNMFERRADVAALAASTLGQGRVLAAGVTSLLTSPSLLPASLWTKAVPWLVRSKANASVVLSDISLSNALGPLAASFNASSAVLFTTYQANATRVASVLAATDLLVLNLDSVTLSDAVIAVIRGWVQAGGALVVGGQPSTTGYGYCPTYSGKRVIFFWHCGAISHMQTSSYI